MEVSAPDRPSRLCLGSCTVPHAEVLALLSAISRPEPSAPRAPCSSPAVASGRLATARLLCKREAESGRLGSSSDTAALPLKQPPDARLSDCWYRTEPATRMLPKTAAYPVRRDLADRREQAGNAPFKSARLPMHSRLARSGTKLAGHVRSLIPGDWNVAVALVRVGAGSTTDAIVQSPARRTRPPGRQRSSRSVRIAARQRTRPPRIRRSAHSGLGKGTRQRSAGCVRFRAQRARLACGRRTGSADARGIPLSAVAPAGVARVAPCCRCCTTIPRHARRASVR